MKTIRNAIIGLVLTCAGMFGQFSISSPTSGQAITGFLGAGNPTPFNFAVIGYPVNTYEVCYAVGGYAVYDPGYGAPYTSPQAPLYTNGCTKDAPFNLPDNTFWLAGGTQTVVATAYGLPTGSGVGLVVLGTSSSVSFTVGNTTPVMCADGSAPASAMTLGGVSGGYMTATLTVSGSCATDAKLVNWYIDGYSQYQSVGLTTSAATAVITLDESQWNNQPHQVCITWLDTTHFTTYGSHQVQAAGQLCQTVTFNNGALPQEVRSDCSDCFIANGATHTLTPTVYNTDGTTLGGITFDYLALNPSVASVNSSGVITAVGTCPIASGLPCSGQILVMGETQSCTDLSTFMGTRQYQSTCHTFTGSDIGRLIHITGGTGFTTGIYQITQVTPISGGTPVVALSPNPTTPGGFSGGLFSMGPTRVVNALVWPTNTMPSWGTDGLIHPSYVSASFIIHSMFGSSGILAGNSVPSYNFAGGGVGPLAEYDNVGINTWEIPILAEPASSYNNSTLASFTTAETNFLNQYTTNLASLRNAKYLYGIGDGIAARTQDQWTANQGGPAQTWGIGMMTQILNQIQATFPNLMMGINLADEGAKNNPQPLAGPITPGGANSWLSATASVVSDGVGHCTINTATGVNFYLNASLDFVIVGSATPSVNTAVGGTYAAPLGSGPVGFNYTCSTVAGTFNDATLEVQPLAAFGYTLNGNTSYLNYDVMANLFGVQVNAQNGNIPVTMSNLSAGSCLPRQTWGGLSTYGPLDGITQIGKFQDFYDDNGALITFLNSRNSMQWNITGQSSPGQFQRNQYGCYNPNLPLSEITSATENLVGLQGYTAPTLTSIVGNVMTFSGPHKLVNVIPGDTRITVSGNSNTNMNTFYYVLGIINQTQLSVAWGTTDFVAACNNGTINFVGGYTRTTSLLSAIGATVDSNIQFTTGSGPTNAGTGFGQGFGINVQDSNMAKHRGEFFVISGCSSGSNAAAFNTHNYVYSTSNLGVPSWDSNGGATPEKDNVYWEIPTGSGTGGTAIIQPDNTSAPGRTGVQMPNESSPAWAFINTLEAFVAGAQMDRWYQQEGTQYSYLNNWGYTGYGRYNSTVFASGSSQSTIFTAAGLTNQFYCGFHWENMGTVPLCNALGQADKAVTRWQKYLLQVRQNSPDLGGSVMNTPVDCTARAGTPGDILFCVNGENGAETKTYTLTPYLQASQSIIQNVVGFDGTNIITILSPGTASQTLTLQEGQAVFFVFPATFVGELNQPTFKPKGSFGSCPSGTTSIVIRWAYNVYLLDVPTGNVASFTTLTGLGAVIPADKNYGPVYGRIYCQSSTLGALSTGDMIIF